MVRDKYLGTKSNKFRRVPYIVEYLMKVIDCQEIRRLCRYYTLDPLADEAFDYDGNLIEQPDLIDSLEHKVVRDKVSKGAEDAILIPETFSNASALSSPFSETTVFKNSLSVISLMDKSI